MRLLSLAQKSQCNLLNAAVFFQKSDFKLAGAGRESLMCIHSFFVTVNETFKPGSKVSLKFKFLWRCRTIAERLI